MSSMTPAQFGKKWSKIQLKERTAAQSHFNDVCALVGHKTSMEVYGWRHNLSDEGILERPLALNLERAEKGRT
jgi:hypothetical protein